MSIDSTQLKRHLRAYRRAPSLAAPWQISLWDHALSLYAHADVRTACLRLQDESGADVCELLWGCWLAHHGLVFDDDVDDALHDVRAWQEKMTVPLRRRRRMLKIQAGCCPNIAELREALKRAELLAERETLIRLQTLAERGQGIRPCHSHDASLPERLARTLALQKKTHFPDLQTLESHLDPPTQPS